MVANIFAAFSHYLFKVQSNLRGGRCCLPLAWQRIMTCDSTKKDLLEFQKHLVELTAQQSPTLHYYFTVLAMN
jgi:hypothetical protein